MGEEKPASNLSEKIKHLKDEIEYNKNYMIIPLTKMRRKNVEK